MRRHFVKGRIAAAAIVLLVSFGACGKKAAADPAADDAVTVGPENITLVARDTLRSGPTISGTLAAEQEAAIRAEIGGRVMQVLVDPGQEVARGQLLLKLDDTGIRDSWLSAKSGYTSARTAADQAHRDEERNQRLADAGALAPRDLEAAHRATLAADAALADAQARLSNAQLQLDRTQIRAPFAGVVSERPANAGDVAQVGTMLVTVVDPIGMRLEGQVPVDQLTALHLGTAVSFTVSGLGDRRFTGRIDRINPSVDPATRQVRLRVSIPNAGHALVSGLYAQGRVGTVARVGLAVPASAVDLTGPSPTVRRLQGGRVSVVPVQLGVRDDVVGRVEIIGAVAAGDTLLLGSAQGLVAGTRVRMMLTDTIRR
ncbi:MAG: efflux RND transporter periplasmic adaptor subunit [Gemmatimonadales bacterium]